MRSLKIENNRRKSLKNGITNSTHQKTTPKEFRLDESILDGPDYLAE